MNWPHAVLQVRTWLKRQASRFDRSPLSKGYAWRTGEEIIPRLDASCPNCFHKKFYEGPSSGLSTNIECAGCGARWDANGVGMRWMFLGFSDDLRTIVRRVRAQQGLAFDRSETVATLEAFRI